MYKLTIMHIECINKNWVALRFSGDDQAFRSMTELLGREKRYNAYWDSTVLKGKAGWIVRIVFLEKYRGRVAMEQKLHLGGRRNRSKKSTNLYEARLGRR